MSPAYLLPDPELVAIAEGVKALVAKYESRAANESSRYVRAVDVVADLRALCAEEQP